MSVALDPSNPALAKYPLASPPPGVIPNFVNPESHAYQLIITVAVCLAFVVIAVSMRLYTKQFITKSMGWDDCKSNTEDMCTIADQRAVTCILGAVKLLDTAMMETVH